MIPGADLETLRRDAAYKKYLDDWRESAKQNAENGEVSASMCLQAAMVDLVSDGRITHDWRGVMDDLLTVDGLPTAYSNKFGQRLYGFGAQTLQPTIHAAHCRWWVEAASGAKELNLEILADAILKKRQADGLIYDRDVSPTILRHRMRTELTMSMAMACDILLAAGRLKEPLTVQLATEVTSPVKCPPLGYLSMEYFRLVALRLLGYEKQFPAGIDEPISKAAEDLEVGWCDFSVKSKVDAYMGTAKRTQRDSPIHSPLIACFVGSLCATCGDNERKIVEERLARYATHLKRNPFDIPAFKMRDVPIPFGADVTPIELICASHLVSKWLPN